MVRRLVQHIVRWIRRFFFQVKDAKPRQQTSAKRRLPPAAPLPNRVRPSGPPADPLQRQADPVASSTMESPPSTLPVAAPRQQPQSTPPKRRNVSSFQVPLSNHQRPPSSDIQALHRQLLTPASPAVSNLDNSKVGDGLSSGRLSGGDVQAPLPVPESPKKQIERPQSVSPMALTDLGYKSAKTKTEISPETLFVEESTDQTIVGKLDGNQDRLQYTQLSQPNEATSSVEPFLPVHRDVSSSYVASKPEIAAATPASTIKPGVLVKQGTIKLLFKLKKNNYHGYITPHDGSKDIIFHQKYVGDAIFSQLERGMSVEVTAHITAGKAYADDIRILGS